MTATDHEDSVSYRDELAGESEAVEETPADENDDDSEFVPRKPWRPTGLTVLLAVCALIGGGFLGGVLTQKHHDRGLTGSSAASLRGALAGRAGGFAGLAGGAGRTGGFEGAAGGSTAGGSAAGGSTAGGSTAGGSTATETATPAVIGTLSALTPTTASVTNLGGTKVAVALSKTTTVTAAYGTTLKVGDSVAVYGAKASTGTVAATSVTVS